MQAKDVAAAVAYLVQHAEDYGYDRERIFLAGHSSGGHLASLVALDPKYLGAHQLDAKAFAGVIVISGIFDVSLDVIRHEIQRKLYNNAFGNDHGVRRDASPVRHLRPDAPPFLVLSAAEDLPHFAVDARRFVLALRKQGNTKAYHHVISKENYLSIIKFAGRTNPKRTYILEFMGAEKPSEFFASRLAARRIWHDPPLSTEPFWKHKKLIKTYPIDKRFRQRIASFFQGNAHMLQAWPFKKYHAIDLFAYLDALGPARAGRGEYLVTTNIRNEKLYWRRRDIARYKPVIVVGIDDERNMFRFAIFYQALRQYSWVEDGERPPLMVRSVGAFIHFRKEPPPEFKLRYFADFSLTTDGKLPARGMARVYVQSGSGRQKNRRHAKPGSRRDCQAALWARGSGAQQNPCRNNQPETLPPSLAGKQGAVKGRRRIP